MMPSKDDGQLRRGCRLRAVLIAIFMIMSSVCFIIIAADHEHHGDDCAVCDRIAVHCIVLKGLIEPLSCICTLLLMFRHYEAIKSFFDDLHHTSSPVTLKVKLTH